MFWVVVFAAALVPARVGEGEEKVRPRGEGRWGDAGALVFAASVVPVRVLLAVVSSPVLSLAASLALAV